MAFVSLAGLVRSSKRRVASMTAESSSVIAGIVFDMDGCLTKQGAIDFAEMRRRAQIPPKADILKHIASLPAEESSRSMAAVLEVEAEGIQRMELRDGLDELFDFLDKNHLRRALLTRNTHLAIDQWQTRPENVVMIGDHSDDIQCGRSAGAMTIQILDQIIPGDEHRDHSLTIPDYTVASLPEMKEVLEQIIADREGEEVQAGMESTMQGG
ncbi:hypothetical protein NDN08_003543 [Rhodosorus marinus]|uniref:Phosphoglycolate phosphatase n=1 Tax=Rhodosorus marinus TaxID=101924 RepID=A0AAV8UXS6_9RHOD|nr:hypothetical protein NDN08_003543 [Rhodosorus marinus]